MSPWTEEFTERAKAMWAEGCSFGTIAAALGLTRNAVCGKLNRMGLVMGRPKWEKRVKKKPAPIEAEEQPQRICGRSTKFAEFEEPTPHMGEPEFLGPPNDFPQGKVCRYSRGEMHKDFQCCAHPGYPYCEFHTRICFNHAGTVRYQQRAA